MGIAKPPRTWRNHSDPRTTKLYDHRKDLATLSEIERRTAFELAHTAETFTCGIQACIDTYGALLKARACSVENKPRECQSSDGGNDAGTICLKADCISASLSDHGFPFGKPTMV